MANKIVQRLLAAGASPQRAQQFALQFQKSVQAKSPSANLKPTDYNDAFDLALDAQSRELFPGVFRPPALDDPKIDDYIEFLSPGKSKVLNDRAYKFSAPTFLAAKTSTVPIEKLFAEAIAAGQTAAGLKSMLLTPEGAQSLGSFPLADANTLADKLFSEYGAAQEKLVLEREKFLNTNQNYKYGLPDPKLQYGTTTDFKKGIVGIDTIPGVKPFVENEMTKFSAARQANPTGITPSSYMNPIENVLSMVKNKGLTPNKDEQQRRFDLKYKK